MDDEKKALLRKHGESEIYIVLSSLIIGYRKLLENPMYITIRAALLMAASNFGAWWLINVGWSKSTAYRVLLFPLFVHILMPYIKASKKYSFEIGIITALEWIFCFMWMIVSIRLYYFPITSDYDIILFWCMVIIGPIVLFTSPNFLSFNGNNTSIQKKVQPWLDLLGPTYSRGLVLLCMSGMLLLIDAS